ncbi:uncharacterized protein [Leptinotarsa decemlineata]|uniref:uncharacterized protein n=1 Tax=Leptinotarsa decemlineata TaxID=7539 RepID=UPI003D30B719
MKLDVLCLIFVGYFINVSEENGGGGKHVHVKIHVPTLINNHKHTHTVYKKVPVHHGGHEKKHIVIHKHDHSHKHKHDHGHKHGHQHKHKHGHKHGHNHGHKHGHKHDHKHKHGHKHDHKHKHLYTPKKTHHDHGWYSYKPEQVANLKEQSESFDIDPHNFDDDGYKSTKKLVRSEHFEVQRRNPYAPPGDEVEVKGSYKVLETDPYDITTTSYHTYDSPVTKEIAQALTDFGRFQTEPRSEEVKESEDYTEAEGEGEGEAGADHEGVEEYDEDTQQYQNYEDYGDNTEKVQHYVADPNHGQLEVGERDYNYGTEHLEKYILNKVYGGESDSKY